MSYSNPNVELSEDGNGVDSLFGVNFSYLEGETSSIIAELWDYTDPDNPSQQSYVLNVDYSIDESAYPATNILTTIPVPSNFKIFIYRNTPKIQTTSLMNGAFPAESVEDMVDRISFMAQEVDAKMGRAILNPIGGPTVDISDILDNTDNIDANTTNIATNTIDIAANLASIGINTGNIATNSSDISTNSSDISTNSSDIATNSSDIAANSLLISGLSPPNLVSLAVASTTHAAADGEIILSKASDITINLPAPVLNTKISVKMDGLQSNTIVNSAAGIDGFGTSYTLLSTYESLSLVSDGTQWYII
jgi:hypothetical protein